MIATIGLSPALEAEEMRAEPRGLQRRRPHRHRLADRAAGAAGGARRNRQAADGGAEERQRAGGELGAAACEPIRDAWYPGEEGGAAIAETLAGENNPAGRLPVTFYASIGQVPPFEDYSMSARTYRYFDGKPLYGFGYGLSYTTFAYSNLKVPSEAKAGEPLSVTGDVKNTGSVAGDEVVELYLSQPKQFETPIRVLASFQRIHLEPGQTTHVSLTVDPRSLGQVDAKGTRVIVPGDYLISLGGSQPGQSASIQTAKFTVTGKAELPK